MGVKAAVKGCWNIWSRRGSRTRPKLRASKCPLLANAARNGPPAVARLRMGFADTERSRDRSYREALYRREAGASGFGLQHGGAVAGRALARRGSPGKSQRHSQRGGSRAQSRRPGQRRRRTIAPRFFITARKILSQRREEIVHRLAAVVGEKQAAAEVELRHRAHFLLCGVG